MMPKFTFASLLLLSTLAHAEPKDVPEDQLYAMNFDCNFEAYRSGPKDESLKKVLNMPFNGKSDPLEGYNGKNATVVLDQTTYDLRFTLNPRGFVFFGDDEEPSEGTHFELLSGGKIVARSDFSTIEESGIPKSFVMRDSFQVGDVHFVVRVLCKTEKLPKKSGKL